MWVCHTERPLCFVFLKKQRKQRMVKKLKLGVDNKNERGIMELVKESQSQSRKSEASTGCDVLG